MGPHNGPPISGKGPMTDFWESTEVPMVPSFGPSCLLYGLVREALVYADRNRTRGEIATHYGAMDKRISALLSSGQEH